VAFDSDTVFLWGEPWVHAQCTPYLPLIKWADGGRLIDTIFGLGLSIAPLLKIFQVASGFGHLYKLTKILLKLTNIFLIDKISGSKVYRF